ncbi:MAG TPA: ion channel DMI1, partial [Marinobacter sp.]
VQMPAASDTLITAEDRVVMLARDYAETEPDARAAALPVIHRGQPVARSVTFYERAHRVLVLGWNRRVPSLISEFSSYNRMRFEVDIVSVVPAPERQQEIERYMGEQQDVLCRHIEADYMVEGELRRVGPLNYDSVMLVSSDRLASGEEADARAMVGYLQLEDLLSEGGQRPQLIMELSDPDNRHLLAGHKSEMMISPMIVSHVLAQVALRRELRVVLDDLFTVGGAEIQFRDPHDYPLPASADFQVLEKVVAAKGEVALGVWRNHANARGHHVTLNPERDEYLDLTTSDRLIVLCNS